MKKLVTDYVFPPIPDRCYDWIAYIDGDEEKREYGWGKTEAEAIQDWRDQYGE